MPRAETRVDQEQESNASRAQARDSDPGIEERSELPSLEVSRVRRLDVDAVLARSLAKVVSE